MTHPMLRSERPGFTFVEVVASLAIVMCVMGLLLPVFLRGKDRAKEVGCGSNLHQLAAGLHLYAQDHDGRFPPRDNKLAPVLSYVKNTGVFICPDEPKSSRDQWKSGALSTSPTGETLDLYSSYQYRSGLRNDDANGEPLAQDWNAWHRGGVNVVNLGGRVQWVRTLNDPQLTAAPRPVPRPGSPVPATQDTLGLLQGE